jgi:hypothetical protein
MNHDKKTYDAPKLETHGTVEDLTQQAGGAHTDVPHGGAPPGSHPPTGTHP